MNNRKGSGVFFYFSFDRFAFGNCEYFGHVVDVAGTTGTTIYRACAKGSPPFFRSGQMLESFSKGGNKGVGSLFSISYRADLKNLSAESRRSSQVSVVFFRELLRLRVIQRDQNQRVEIKGSESFLYFL